MLREGSGLLTQARGLSVTHEAASSPVKSIDQSQLLRCLGPSASFTRVASHSGNELLVQHLSTFIRSTKDIHPGPLLGSTSSIGMVQILAASSAPFWEWIMRIPDLEDISPQYHQPSLVDILHGGIREPPGPFDGSCGFTPDREAGIVHARAIFRNLSARRLQPMSDLQVDSLAFRKALLQSERRRIFGVTAFLLAFVVAAGVRIFIFRSSVNPWALVALFFLLAYELLMLWVVRKALVTGNDLPQALWTLSIVLEISFPVVGIACFSSPLLLAFEYRPLATPWVLSLTPIIMLSVLRLNPQVSRIAGIAATGGFWRARTIWAGALVLRI